MPAKARKLSDLTDDEIEAERKRRREANKPKHVNVIRMTEEQFKRLVAEEAADDDDDGDDDTDVDDDAGGGSYFS